MCVFGFKFCVLIKVATNNWNPKQKEKKTKQNGKQQHNKERERERKKTETVKIIEVILLITQNVEYMFLSLSSARFIYLGKIIDLSFSVRSIQ